LSTQSVLLLLLLLGLLLWACRAHPPLPASLPPFGGRSSAAAYLLLAYPHVRTPNVTCGFYDMLTRCSPLVLWLPQVKQAGKWVSWALSPKSKVNALPTATSPLKAFSPRTLQAVPM
jgi:hypothetical protein